MVKPEETTMYTKYREPSPLRSSVDAVILIGGHALYALALAWFLVSGS